MRIFVGRCLFSGLLPLFNVLESVQRNRHTCAPVLSCPFRIKQLAEDSDFYEIQQYQQKSEYLFLVLHAPKSSWLHLEIRTLREAVKLNLKQKYQPPSQALATLLLWGKGIWGVRGDFSNRVWVWGIGIYQEEAPRSYRGGRPTLVSTLTDRRMDVALGNQNKVKYMATQLLAKFEENAPPQSTGMRRQVNPTLHLIHPHLVWPHRMEG